MNHDSHFKNLIEDFPKETLRWLMPDLEEHFGPITKVDFLRQEMSKHWLSDKGRELDFPIRYTFETQQVLISLIEHQSTKKHFSIHKLAHYTIDLIQAYPDTVILPIVIFADDTKWRKDVQRELKIELNGTLWFYFRFHKVKLKNIPMEKGCSTGTEN